MSPDTAAGAGHVLNPLGQVQGEEQHGLQQCC